MSNFSRRSFIAGVATIPFSVWFKEYSSAQAPLTRHDAWSPQGQTMLAKYAKAVKTMMSTGEGDPRSWVFQWYTHWVKGSTTKSDEIARVYTNPADPRRAIAQEMWQTCQAHADTDDPNFFLPWHRMYVYFFERIVRSLSGDPAFALPYWNYSTSTPAQHGIIPPQFRQKGDPTFGPLYVEKRNVPPNAPNVNKGEPIDKDQPGNILNLGALSECSYEPQGVRRGFCMRIDNGLHGTVHVQVGDPENMGDVPWAAGDPIFWLHHCNIDRLWESWNRAGRKNPTNQQWLLQQFVFADENGNRVLATVKDFLDVGKLGYSYDRYETVPTCPPPGPLAPTSLERRAAVPTGAIQLGSSPVRVTLEPLQEPGAGPFMPLPARVENLPPERRLYLLTKDLRAEAQPGVLYHVYLDMPPGTPPEKGAPHYVGTINFFDASQQDGPHGGTAAAGTQKFFSFDVTEVAKYLQSKKQLNAKPTLTIAPSGQPAAAAKPVVGDILLVEQ